MEMSKNSLVNKSCSPCDRGILPLTSDKIKNLLEELGNNWALNSAGHLYKEYIFTNFMASMVFANKIAVIAEAEDHHPDLKIAWGMCAVEIWTHIVDGLTENDFILAAKIEVSYDKR